MSNPTNYEPILPPLPKPLQSSKYWDRGIEWALAGERAVRLEREDQLRESLAESLRLKADLAAANVQIQDLQQGRCGMCNEFPGNPVHGSGEGQHAFVTSEAEIMRQNAAAAHQAQRYAALEKRLETMATALRYVIKVRAIRCTSHPAGDLSCARCRADAALVSEDGQ